MKILSILFLVPFLTGSALLAKDIPVDDSLSNKNISRDAWYVEDAEKKLSPRELERDTSLRWRVIGKDYINFGYTTSRFWFRCTVDNRTDGMLRWLLQIDSPTIDMIGLYVPDGSGGYRSRETGFALPFSSRDVKYINYIFRLTQKPGPMTFFIRVDSLNAMNFNLNMLSYDRFLEMLNNDLPIYWVFFGLMIIMALYNLFFFFSSRMNGYLYLACFIFSYALFEFNIKGFASRYLWPDATWWPSRATPFLICMVTMWVTLFLFNFVQENKKGRYYRRLLYLLILVIISSLVLAAASLILNLQLSLLLIFILAIAVTIGQVAIGVYLGFFNRPYSRQARIVLLAFSVFVIGVPVAILTMAGFLPLNLFTRWSLQFGTATAMVFLSFGMADKINSMRSLINVGEERYRHLVETTGDMIFTLDGDNTILSLNSAVKFHLGFRAEELVNRNFMELLQDTTGRTYSISQQIAQEYLSDLKARKKGSIQFRATMREKYNHEPKELMVSLEYAGGTGAGYAILGKASPVIDDALNPFLVGERFEYSLNNYLGNAELMSRMLVRSLSRYVDSPVISDMRIALREAIINSIEHGNLNLTFDEKTEAQINGRYFDLVKERQMDAAFNEKKVTVEYTLSGDGVSYAISDEGEGFDHGSMRSFDCEIGEGPLAHGRGLAMIRAAFDVVQFNKKGNRIMLIKHFNKT